MLNINEHLYTLASTGYKMRSKTFLSRQEARNEMYRIMDKKGMHVIKKYDDNHFKTYICDNNVTFYINRIC